MRHIGLCMLILAGLARAGDGDAATGLAALEAERDASELGYVEKWKAFKPRFEAFAKKYAGTEEALTAKLWLLGQTWWLRQEGTMSEAAGALADEILKEYPKSPQLGQLVLCHYVFDAAQRQRYFTWLLENSPHREVQAAALFGLGRIALRTVKGPDGRAQLERLAKEYGDVAYRKTTYGAVARALLDPHAPAALEVGKEAPEIEGVDQDGQPLKLSDFRGRVVVLDFWGDW